MSLKVVIDSIDNAPSLLLDDVEVRHYPAGGVAATNCAWNGVFGGEAVGQGLIVATAAQLPGIPDGLVPLPPPLEMNPTVTAQATVTTAPLPEPSLTPLPSATVEPTEALPVPSVTPAPTDLPPPAESTPEVTPGL